MSPSRLFIATLVISALLIAITGLSAWALLNAQASSATVFIVLVAGLLALLVMLWGGYVMLQTRLFRPLRMLEEQLRMLTYSNAEHRLQLPGDHLLGSLPDTAQELGGALSKERHQTDRTIDSAITRIERRKARLEAILQDLTEGVVVCSIDHRIVLFNQAASDQLGRSGSFGLHRNILRFFAEGLIARQFQALTDRYHNGEKRGISEFDCKLNEDDRSLHVRMTLIIDFDRSCNGYVISFPGGASRPGSQGQDEYSMLSERPVFYDFSLFDRDPSVEFSDRPLGELPYVVFDTETTGLYPSKGDEIVQLSGVRIVNGDIIAGEEFDRLVDPGIHIPSSSTRFHGITDDMVAGAPDIETVLGEFHKFAEDTVLVAHNAAFDMKFLKLKEHQTGLSFGQPVLDTLLLSFILQPAHSAHTLDAIASRLGVEIPPEARHTALGDARCTGQIFLRMLDALPHQGISSLSEALQASNRVFEIRKLQERF